MWHCHQAQRKDLSFSPLSFLLQLPNFPRALSQAAIASCSSFSPFPFTVNPQWRNNGLNPISESNVTTPISSQPLAFAVESFVDNISEELGEAGRERCGANSQEHFPVLPNTRSTPGCGAALGTIPNHPTFYGLSGITQTPRNPSNGTWQHPQAP